MTALTQLDVINEMLASLGESPINAIDEAHPLVAAGLRMLKIANLREQSKSWWFNKEQVMLTPDAVSGYIYTPSDSIRVDPTDGSLNYVQRGRRLYASYASAAINKYVFKDPVLCWLVRELPFDDLPPSAQIMISYAAQIDFQKAYDADPIKARMIDAEYKTALMELNAEHTRNVNANMFNRPGVQRVMNRIGAGGLYPQLTGTFNV